MSLTAFSAPGSFYRGNLHTHSNRSDGAFSPDEVCQRYAEQGYDFVALTDHFVGLYDYPITKATEGKIDNFTTLLGAELHTGRMENGDIWHILAVGLPPDFAPGHAPHFGPVEGSESGAELAKRARDAGAFVAIAHPEWSGLSLPDAVSIDAAHAVEIYNHSCYVECDRGRGHYIVDALQSGGRQIGICATDDAHFNIEDAFGGWVMVKAQSNTNADLLAALKAGQYYASTGAELHDVRIEDRDVIVECSKASSIMVVGAGSANTSIHGHELTSGRFKINKLHGSPWMRVVVRGMNGTMAWGQPVHF